MSPSCCRLLLLLLLAGLFPLAGLVAPARAEWSPVGLDLSRPRLLHLQGDPARFAQRALQDPYRQIVLDMVRRASLADGIPLDDDSISGQRFKARAAKVWAFLYAIGIDVQGGEVVPFADEAARRAAGDRARDWLLNLFPYSRLSVPPPLGGWDRDISTSEELLQWATAYDTLLGAGYPFTPDDVATIEAGIADIAEALYSDYIDGRADLHQNNHRSKSGASMVAAGIVLAHLPHDPLADPEGRRDPKRWIAFGLTQIDLIMRWALVAGDGAYAEGPFYLRFASQNLLPVLRTWNRIAKGRASDHPSLGLPPHRAVPDLWTHPLFRRSLRWELDMTMPDGRLVAQDDGSPGRSYYFGIAPGADLEAAFGWRFANAPQPYEGDGNVDLGPDAVVFFDATVPPAPPPGPTTRFYPEGGNAIFRSDWSDEAVVAVVQGEHDVASEFGRDPDGQPVAPESHEHAEPGAFLLDAFGERLLLDPGYENFPTRHFTAEPQHHSMIIVDGRGPIAYLLASGLWAASPAGRPPADGHAQLFDLHDTPFVDAASVVTRYAGAVDDLLADTARIERRFLFADDRYLVLADRVDSEGARPRDLAIYFQGNAGEDAGGSVVTGPLGARFERARARVDVAVDSLAAPLSFRTTPSNHVTDAKDIVQHSALVAEATTGSLRTLSLIYPTRTGQAPPQLGEIPVFGVAGLQLRDDAGDRVLAAFHRDGPGTPVHVGYGVSGPGIPVGLYTDGRLGLYDQRLDGSVRLAWAEQATQMAVRGAVVLEAAEPATLGIAMEPERVSILHGGDEREIPLPPGLPFDPASFEGVCGRIDDATGTRLLLSGERRIVLHAAPGASRPAADPGPSRRGDVGSWITLDGSASCAFGGGTLYPSWKLVSAPPGSDWELARAATFSPMLHLDRPGPYRLELRVRDAAGVESRPNEVLVLAGDPCEGSHDEDRDGFFDSDDPDCDQGPIAPAAAAACGVGFELAALLPALLGLRALRRRRR